MGSRQPRPPVSEIIPGLFITNQEVFFTDLTLLSANNIGAVVSLVTNEVAIWQLSIFTENVSKKYHLWIKCEDSLKQNLLVYMNEVCNFIDHALHPSTDSTLTEEDPSKTGKGIIVHCEEGVSRSPTMVVAYLMWKQKLTRDEALSLVKSKRRVKPNANFMDQLQVWEDVDFEIWEDAEKTIPKKAYQGYLDRRAAYLKEKGLTGNEPIGIVDLAEYVASLRT